MNVDLESYIYRQHPVYRLPSREDGSALIGRPVFFQEALYE